MMRIKRRRKPRFMSQAEFGKLEEELVAFFGGRGGTRGTGQRLSIDKLVEPYRDRLVEALDEQFHGKCAYSEIAATNADFQTRIITKQQAKAPEYGLQLTRHRPTGDAISTDGHVDPLHYWWLSLDWSNLFLATEHVVSVKHDQFPVLGRRTEPPEKALKTSRDAGVLLDPTRDDPAFWLYFHEKGSVEPAFHPADRQRARWDPFHRGETTIDLLGLNEKRLVRSRSRAIGRARRRFIDSRITGDKAVVELLQDPYLEHRGAILQVIGRDIVASLDDYGPATLRVVIATLLDEAPDIIGAEFLRTEPGTNEPDLLRELRPVAQWVAKQIPELRDDERVTAILASRPSKAPPPPKRPEPEPRDDIVIQPTDRITRILVKDFRAIRSIEVTIDHEMFELPVPYQPADPEQDTPIKAVRWKVLLGENGSGKSSILQAVALALAGDRVEAVRTAAGLEWSDILRREAEPGERRQGKVVLEFTGGKKIDFRFNENKHWFHGLGGGAPAMLINLRAYGATRLLGNEPGSPDAPAETDTDRASALSEPNVANLFDPGVRVMNAKSWLLGLGDDQFRIAAITLADLLGIQSSVEEAAPGPRVTRKVSLGEIFVDNDRLDDISDGYRSVIAVGCDIMAGIGGLHLEDGGFGDLANARGIVLIDEIGAHLHPRWRMQITDKLRRALPNVQFIVTTHEPLCLRGLYENEVVRVLKYRKYGVVVDEIDKAPAKYRVDQLLTSEFFGLDSAVDPEVDARFQRYYELRRKDVRTEAERDELAGLDLELNSRLRPNLGYTRRDQLIYEAIDEFLIHQGATDRRQPPTADERLKRRRETIERVRDIWAGLERSTIREAR